MSISTARPFRNRWMLILPLSAWLAAPAPGSWLSDKTGIDINLNREVGSGISEIAGPSFDRAEKVGRALIDEADKSMQSRLQQFDQIAASNLGRVDSILERRLAQVDNIAAQRLDQVDSILAQNIRRVDELTSQRLQDANQLVGQRLGEVDRMTQRAIADLDDRLEARIVQIDELTAKQIASVGTVIEMGTINLEAMLRQVVVLVCILGFLTMAIWRLWAAALKPEAGKGPLTVKSALAALQKRWRPLVPQLAAALVAAVFLYGLYLILPGSPARKLRSLQASAEKRLDESLTQLNLSEARYYAAQLKLLAPGDPLPQARLAKVELIVATLRAVSAAGRRDSSVLDSIEGLERTLGPNDPDLETLAAVVTWRFGEGRKAELASASLAATALRSEKSFALLPLALAYVQNYLEDPIPELMLQRAGIRPAIGEGEMRELLDAGRRRLAAEGRDKGIAKDAVRYNALVGKALSRTREAYSEMLSAAISADDVAVKQAANTITLTWRELDAGLDETPSLVDQPLSLSVFALPDAYYARACWYAFYGAATSGLSSIHLASVNTPLQAVQCAPPRVVWAKRYLSGLTSETASVTALQAAEQNSLLDSTLATAERALAATRTEIRGQRRPMVILQEGENAVTALGAAGLSKLALALLEEMRLNTAAADAPRLEEIEGALTRSFLSSRSPLV